MDMTCKLILMDMTCCFVSATPCSGGWFDPKLSSCLFTKQTYENVPKQLSFGAWVTNVNTIWL